MINSLSSIGWADLQGPKEAPKVAPPAAKSPQKAKKTDKKVVAGAGCDTEYGDYAYPKYKY